jgi:hypothetical protein
MLRVRLLVGVGLTETAGGEMTSSAVWSQ